MGRPSRDRLVEFADKIRNGYSIRDIIQEEDLREDSVRRYISWCRDEDILPKGTRIDGDTVVGDDGNPISVLRGSSRKISKTVSDKGMEISVVSRDIDTVDAALEKAGIDKSRWDIDKFIVSSREIEQKKWHHEEFGDDFGPLWTVKIWLKPKAISVDDAAKKISDTFAKNSAAKVIRRERRDGGLLCELCFPDLHIGKYAWSRETGDDYDIKLAISALEDSTDELLERASAMRPEAILIPIGNDLLHVDNLDGTTTKGTAMDVDSRYQKIFEETISALLRLIDKSREIAPVQIVIVPGNHDELACFHVGEVLRGWYSRCEDVSIDNEPTTRKYFRWGTNLLGFVHGGKDDPDPKTLPLLMAVERKVDWAETSYREIQAGHIHKRRHITWMSLDSEAGVHFRVLPSLCATDAWHARNGFIGQPRVAEMYMYDKENGFIGMFSSKDIRV